MIGSTVELMALPQDLIVLQCSYVVATDGMAIEALDAGFSSYAVRMNPIQPQTACWDRDRSLITQLVAEDQAACHWGDQLYEERLEMHLDCSIGEASIECLLP